MTWMDSHSHLSDQRMASEVDLALTEARNAGISFFLQGGLGPQDWDRQKQLAARTPGIGTCFGLHPYWVADHSLEECEAALDVLAREISQALALGETGLDFRPHIAKGSEDRQVQMFEAQLELAEMARKPVVLHIVQAFEETIQILELWGVPPDGGFVHSFNGSGAQARKYLDLGLLLSIGGPVCRPDNQRLHQAIREIPLDKILLESDSPDQPPPSRKGENNHPMTILEVAEKIAEIHGKTKTEILDRCAKNLQNILHIQDGARL